MNWITASFNRFFGESEETKFKRIAELPDLPYSQLRKAEKQGFAEFITELVEQKEIADSVCKQLWNKSNGNTEFFWRFRYLQHALKQELEGNQFARV